MGPTAVVEAAIPYAQHGEGLQKTVKVPGGADQVRKLSILSCLGVSLCRWLAC
jgi:hypothetical protein